MTEEELLHVFCKLCGGNEVLCVLRRLGLYEGSEGPAQPHRRKRTSDSYAVGRSGTIELNTGETEGPSVGDEVNGRRGKERRSYRSAAGVKERGELSFVCRRRLVWALGSCDTRASAEPQPCRVPEHRVSEGFSTVKLFSNSFQ